MKIMTQEEKAKAYDMAIERLRNAFYDNNGRMCEEYRKAVIRIIEPIFPELKENEDERIRKAIIKFIKVSKPEWESYSDYSSWIAWLEKQDKKVEPIESFNTEFERQISHIIASTINKEYEYTEDSVKWASNALLNYAKRELEKRGEQKPTSDTMYEVKASDSLSVGNGKPFDYEHTTITQEDFAPKVEPKFNVGDWIVCCDYEPVQIIGIRTNTYYEMSNGDIRPIYMVDNNHNIRFWTIQDAKDGDVLTNGEIILIFKQFEEPSYRQHIIAYVGLDISSNIQVTDGYWQLGVDKTSPATKEQRDLLFQKMHEAGYEWDAERKGLKKIEQNPINKIEPKFKVGDYIERKDGLGYHAKIIFVGGNVYGCEKLIHSEEESPFFEFMFKNQDEFQISSDFQRKPAWSKKDSLYYDDICEILINLLHSESPNVNKSAIQKDLDWFITFVTQTKK